jgi:hypothetical protein
MLQEDGEMLTKKNHNRLYRRITAKGGKEVVAYFKVLLRNSSGWTKESNEKPR